MELPYELRTAIEKHTAGANVTKLTQDAQAVSLRYRTESGTGKRLLNKDSEAAAYAASRMPATYGAVYTALGYALEYSQCKPQTLLDAGAGTGAAAWAADTMLDLKNIVCLEWEAAMINTGQKLMTEAPELYEKTKWVSFDLAAEPIREKADIIIAAYVLNEMSTEDRMEAVKKLWNACNMLTILVEPGTPAGYAGLRAARGYLLETGAHILAPCPHAGECRMSKEDWCHFTCRIARSRLHRQLKGGEAPYEDEKFSYMAFSREAYPLVQHRILRHPMTSKGRITINVCSREGIRNVDILKKEGELYKRAQKLKCGDEIHL